MVEPYIQRLEPESLKEFISKIIELDLKYFPFPWSDQLWRELSLLEGMYNLFTIKVQRDSNEVIGFALYNVSEPSEQAHLIKILIDPSRRNSGYAQKLLAKSINDLKSTYLIKSVFLEVSVNNVTALKLYTGNSFKKLCLKKKFYDNGDDAYAMQLIF